LGPAETVEGILKVTGLEEGDLTLDVTETVYLKALENTVALDRLRMLGVMFSIDGFGTGYSSISYLKRLLADAIQVDKSSVKGLGESVEDTAIVRMVVELAYTLGMEVIVEGVEGEEQARLLREMGCDIAQGFTSRSRCLLKRLRSYRRSKPPPSPRSGCPRSKGRGLPSRL
jgi:EAL domain-containing protein (putative c-di-GMP-specific phosphodiesterase class I)